MIDQPNDEVITAAKDELAGIMSTHGITANEALVEDVSNANCALAMTSY